MFLTDKGVDVVGAVKETDMIESDMAACMEDAVDDVGFRCG